jgi:hypothetical protein
MAHASTSWKREQPSPNPKGRPRGAKDVYPRIRLVLAELIQMDTERLRATLRKAMGDKELVLEVALAPAPARDTDRLLDARGAAMMSDVGAIERELLGELERARTEKERDERSSARTRSSGPEDGRGVDDVL